VSDDETIRKALVWLTRLGAKLRTAPAERRRSPLVDLGRQTGLSASMLSQLENSKLDAHSCPRWSASPWFSTWVWSTSSADGKREKAAHGGAQSGPRSAFPITRKPPRAKLPLRVVWPGANFDTADVRLYLAEIMRVPPRRVCRRHAHEGAEFFSRAGGQRGDPATAMKTHVLHMKATACSFDSSARARVPGRIFADTGEGNGGDHGRSHLVRDPDVPKRDAQAVSFWVVWRGLRGNLLNPDGRAIVAGGMQ
jgi:hypothetical protein